MKSKIQNNSKTYINHAISNCNLKFKKLNKKITNIKKPYFNRKVLKKKSTIYIKKKKKLKTIWIPK